jgi:hypothetical protein
VSVMTEDKQKVPQQGTESASPQVSDPSSDSPERSVSPMSVAVSGLGSGLGLGGLASSVKPPEKAPETSGQALSGLAKPKVFEGPKVELQQSIVRKMEAAIPEMEKTQATAHAAGAKKVEEWDAEWKKKPQDEQMRELSTHAKEKQLRMKAVPTPKYDRDVLYVGSIVLGRIPPPGEDERAMVADSRLVFTDDYSIDAADNGIELPRAAKVEQDIVTNTLETMIKAGQIDYLRKSGFVGDQWKVVVEVHYYRKRNKNQANLHKDTIGQTLFVNLNYTNEAPMPGPELVSNPPLVPEHEEHLKGSLPAQFRSDLDEARGSLGKPTEITTQPIMPHGVVSFVDEAVHHATPLKGHRKAPVSGVKLFLAEDQDFKDLYKTALKAWEWAHPTTAFWKWWGAYKFEDTFAKTVPTKTVATWEKLIELCQQPDATEVDRPELLKTGLTQDQITRLVSGYGTSPFTSAHISGQARVGHATGRLPMTEPGKKRPITLTRQASTANLLEDKAEKEKVVPEDPGGDRRFFRTWVRAVKVSG